MGASNMARAARKSKPSTACEAGYRGRLKSVMDAAICASDPDARYAVGFVPLTPLSCSRIYFHLAAQRRCKALGCKGLTHQRIQKRFTIRRRRIDGVAPGSERPLIAYCDALPSGIDMHVRSELYAFLRNAANAEAPVMSDKSVVLPNWLEFAQMTRDNKVEQKEEPTKDNQYNIGIAN